MPHKPAKKTYDGFPIVVASDQFRVNAVGDKLLMPDGRVCYLLFFDGDEPFRGAPWLDEYWELFKTRNGFHAIGRYLADLKTKLSWFSDWKEMYPKSDYILSNWDWLMPHTSEELDFILKVAKPVQPKIVRYYRDKRVFETWGGMEATMKEQGNILKTRIPGSRLESSRESSTGSSTMRGGNGGKRQA